MARLSRRDLLKTTAAAGMATAAGSLIGGRARAQTMGGSSKLLFVFTASGGGNIIDSLLPVAESEVSSLEHARTLVTYPDELIVQPNGSNIRAVKKHISDIDGIPYGAPYDMGTFLSKHAADTAVFTVEGTSVNHRVAQKRSLTGANANKGRTLMEANAAANGQGLLLPNVNMSIDGYIEPGEDPSTPAFARPETVANALLFPLALDSVRGVADVPTRLRGTYATRDNALLARARKVRNTLDDKSVFGRTFKGSSVLERYLRQRNELGPAMEAADLISKLMIAPNDPGSVPLSEFDLESTPLSTRLGQAFPRLLQDPLEAQAALAFVLARYGVASSLTIGPSFTPIVGDFSIINTPLAFDFSHSSHMATQNVMWTRMFQMIDPFIELLKETDMNGDPSQGKMWDHSLVYIATEFGRDKTRPTGSTSFGTGHHLNNGSVIISPLINGNRVYGGVDPETCLTYGFDPQTGAAAPGSLMREGDMYSAIMHALGIDFDGRRDFDAFVRNA